MAFGRDLQVPGVDAANRLSRQRPAACFDAIPQPAGEGRRVAGRCSAATSANSTGEPGEAHWARLRAHCRGSGATAQAFATRACLNTLLTYAGGPISIPRRCRLLSLASKSGGTAADGAAVSRR